MVDKKCEIDVSLVDLNRLERLSTDKPGLLEYAHSVGGSVITPFEETNTKNKAIIAMKQQAQMQLDMLYEQVKLIANQMQNIKKRVVASELIYNCKINFEPIVGENYYLYLKENIKILSMISPEEWTRGVPPYEFIAEVELLADHTWKILREKE